MNQNPKKQLVRKLTIRRDDPFLDIFVPDVKEDEGTKSLRNDHQNGGKQFQLVSDVKVGKKDSDSDDLSCDSTRSEKARPKVPDNAPWKTENYYKLPQNVRNAIDIAEAKQKHSSFFNRLTVLNDKIYVFRELFYDKTPEFQKKYNMKKQAALEDELKKQKLEFEKQFKLNKKKSGMKTNSNNRVSWDKFQEKVKEKEQSLRISLPVEDTKSFSESNKSGFSNMQIGTSALQLMKQFKAEQDRRSERRASRVGSQSVGLMCSGSYSLDQLHSKPKLTDIKVRPVMEPTEEQFTKVITEADEIDEINTPLRPRDVNGLQSCRKEESSKIDLVAIQNAHSIGSLLPDLNLPKTPKPTLKLFKKPNFMPECAEEDLKPQSQSTKNRRVNRRRAAVDVTGSTCVSSTESTINQMPLLKLQDCETNYHSISKRYYHYDAHQSKEENIKLRANLYHNLENFALNKETISKKHSKMSNQSICHNILKVEKQNKLPQIHSGHVKVSELPGFRNFQRAQRRHQQPTLNDILKISVSKSSHVKRSPYMTPQHKVFMQKQQDVGFSLKCPITDQEQYIS